MLMTLADIENLSVDELILKADFCSLLGADSILKLTPEDKLLYTLLYKGEHDQKEIAEKLQVSHSSLRMMRSKLYNEGYLRNKILCALLGKIFEKQPIRTYNRKPAEESLSKIPYFSSPDSEIVGFADSKEELHTNPALRNFVHATVIILIAKTLPDNELFFVLANKKSYNAENMTNVTLPTNRYDTVGGHLESIDIPQGEKKLSKEAFFNCAVRELSEELHIRKQKLRPEKLRFLFDISYKNEQNERCNNEYSYVYFFPIENDADARIRERYYDTLGKPVQKELPLRYFLLQDMLNLPLENQCDGLGRVIAHLKTTDRRVLYE
jgi:8-oxo-dGTP pyrophosphatase MutT (NUDIX family)